MPMRQTSLSRRTLFKGLVASAIGLAACDGAGRRPPSTPTQEPLMITEENAEAMLLHYKPWRDVAGDAHPFYHSGTWYLFHLTQNFNSRLLTSTDLVHWQRARISHTPTGMGNPTLQPYYVLGVFWDEVAGLFRTYHGDVGNVMKSHTSSDLLNWDFAPPSYTVPAQERYSQQRDPYVFWNDAEQQYWVVMTCKVKGVPDGANGAVCFASAKDLQHWAGRGDLYYPGNISDPEVPQVFRIGDKWYLLASIYQPGRGVGKPSYWVSDRPTGPWETRQPNSLDGGDLQAGNVGFDGRRWLLFGWIPLTDLESHGAYTWGGHFAFPRQVYPLPDGALATRLEPGVGQAIRGRLLFGGDFSPLQAETGRWALGDQAAAFTGTTGYGTMALPGTFERVDLDIRLTPGAGNQRLGLLLQTATSVPVEVAIDRANSRLVVRDGRDLPHERVFAMLSIPWAARDYDARLIVEENMVELFVNDRYSLAARLGDVMRPFTLRLFAEGGPATFANLSIYWLKTLKEIG